MNRRQAKRKIVGIKESQLKGQQENKNDDVYNGKIDRQNKLAKERQRKIEQIRKNRKKREKERRKRKMEKEKEREIR